MTGANDDFRGWEAGLREEAPADRQAAYREAVVKFLYWLRLTGGKNGSQRALAAENGEISKNAPNRRISRNPEFYASARLGARPFGGFAWRNGCAMEWAGGGR